MTGFEDSKKRAFLAGIDQDRLEEMKEVYKENKALDELLVIEITKMLSIALELATGKIAPDMDIIGKYNPELRKVMFLPRMDVMEYTELKQHYKAKRKALIAA